MDIRERLVDILHRHYYPTMHGSIADCTLIECADEILTLIKEAGYRKVEGKPPVLSDKKIEILWRPIFTAHGFSGIYEASRVVAQAQREKDIEFYDSK